MKPSDFITWAFENPGIFLSVAGGLAVFLLGLSVWGIKRTLRRRKDRLLPAGDNPALTDVADAARAAAVRADHGSGANDEDGAGHEKIVANVDDIGKADDDDGEPELATLQPMRIDNEVTAPEVVANPSPEAEASEPDAPDTPPPEPEAPVPAAASSLENDFRAISQAVFDRNFPRLHAQAYEEAAANFAVFADRLAAVAAERLTPDELALATHADVQLLLCSLLGEVSKRQDAEKYGVLIALLIGRIKHHDNPNIVELLDHAIEEVGRLNVGQIRVVIMCLYLRGFQIKSGGIEALEKVVKYAVDFGMGANFSNMRTGLLFTRGLLMHNTALERIEIQILRKFPAAFGDGSELPKNMDRAAAIRLVHEKLHLSSDQCAVLEAWGQTQSGRATATGIGWATAAAYIEHRTGQPADWQRVVH
jgi:hypothetical protein